MQPFARPVVRVVWSHARLGFDRAAARPRATFGGLKVQAPSICLRCSIRAIGARGRFYSSQIPPKGPATGSKPTSAEKESDVELKSKLRTDERYPEDVKPEYTDRAHELPSTTDSRRSDITAKFSHWMDNLQSRVLVASQTLNDVTGYSSIEAIKRQNTELETALADAHERVRSARQAYKSSNTKRAATQREVTTLLARKDSWSPPDLERFTELYRTDHVLEGEVVSSQEALTEAEADEQSLSQRLNAGILKRYHEEQIWSDRIRRASTWGTWGLMGMNFFLFVVLQFLAEPWKRRRLVRGVVAEEKAVLEEVRVQLEEVKLALLKRQEAVEVEASIEAPVEALGETFELPAETASAEEAVSSLVELPADIPEALLDTMVETSPAPADSWKAFLLDPSRWRPFAEDLYSERRVDLRMRDASLLALEGAAAGAVLMGGVVLLLVRR
ncbi:Fc.00g092420.m01.CDS01 [Cosmosporella sp. VM-42]